MMDIVVRHSDIETSRLRCGSTPLETREGTQSLDEIECTRRRPNRHWNLYATHTLGNRFKSINRYHSYSKLSVFGRF